MLQIGISSHFHCFPVGPLLGVVPRGRGVGDHHSSPPLFFHKKLRKVGLFLKKKNIFLMRSKVGGKKFQNFSPLGGGWVVGCHSSPPIFFHKKLRKVGLFLRTFFRIKIYAAVPEICSKTTK